MKLGVDRFFADEWQNTDVNFCPEPIQAKGKITSVIKK